MFPAVGAHSNTAVSILCADSEGCTHATNLKGVSGLFVPLGSEVDSVVVGFAVSESE